MNLLVDMGNSRLKWATSDGLRWESGIPISNDNINNAVLIERWQALGRPAYMAIACVNTTHYNQVVSIADALWPGVCVMRAQSETSAFGVTNAYTEPHKLGVDRWLGMIASYHRFRQAVCIIGCGTAMTVDVIDRSGQHIGGLISPGLRLMRNALALGTENLGYIEEDYPVGLAKLTEAAIHSGTLMAASGLIQQVLTQIPFDVQLVLTGGDATRLVSLVEQPACLEPELVLHGLQLLLECQ